MSGPESKIEQYFRQELERYGFKVVKFVPQGFAGAPDRWVFRPIWSPGPPWLVEMKAEGEAPRKLQQAASNDLEARGIKVLPFIDSKTRADLRITRLVKICVAEADLAYRAMLPSHIIRKANQG